MTIQWNLAKGMAMLAAIVAACIAQGVIPPEYTPIATAVIGLMGGLPLNTRSR
jgi:hypothetical protein